MLQPDPVTCQFFLDSYHISPEASEGRVVFQFFLSGEYAVRVGESNFSSEKASAFIIPSSQRFSLRGKGKCCLISCGLTYVGSLLRTSVGASLSSLLPSSREGQFRAFNLSDHTVLRLESILDVIAEETGFRRSDYLEMVHFQLYEMLLLLRREGAMKSGELKEWASRERIWTIDDVTSYLADNYDNSFSLDDLASRCGLNSSYFSRVFRERAGVPLFEYINRLRIERSVQLLKNSPMTILEIAMTVGYNNISFFNRYFRKLKGCSPGEYRKRIVK